MAHVEETEDVVASSDVEAKEAQSPDTAEPAEVNGKDTGDEASNAEEGGNQDEGGSSKAEEVQDDKEYEIEKILNARRSVIEKGQYAYFVRWKGYGSDEDSWVRPEDAGNAQELIEEYWRKLRKDTSAAATRRKGDASSRASLSSNKRRARSLTSKEVSSPPADTATKRGRMKRRGASPAPAGSDGPEAASAPDDDDADEGSVRAKKKPRKSTKAENGKARRKSLTALDRDGDGDVVMDSGDAHVAAAAQDGDIEESLQFTSMAKYMSQKSWESLVSKIDTIERNSNGDLFVFFQLKSGEHCREKSTICAQRFPQMLLKFYEGNLRWRVMNDDDDG